MSEPLTIYVCPACGWWEGDANRDPDGDCNGADASPWPTHALTEMVPVRVFREEDVRPLWEAAEERTDSVYRSGVLEAAVEAFPSPEEWLS